MKANANLEGAAAGAEHRKEREYSPLSYTRALPYPTGESFSDGCTPSSEPPSIHACYPLGNCGRTIEIKGVAGGGGSTLPGVACIRRVWRGNFFH